jgi:FixJ family two-component response regulator
VQENLVITIVDDDESVRASMTDLIRSMGFIAEAFQRAEDYLASSRLHGTSCLIADVQMPGMTGIELYDALVKAGNKIPTILITAFPNDRDRTLALRAGVTCYLVKPFNDDDLNECIRSALGNRVAGGGKS